jgi:hypothetical protein
VTFSVFFSQAAANSETASRRRLWSDLEQSWSESGTPARGSPLHQVVCVCACVCTHTRTHFKQSWSVSGTPARSSPLNQVLCVCVYTHTHTLQTQLVLRLGVAPYIRLCVCACVCVCTHTHTHTHLKHSWSVSGFPAG